MRKEDRVKKLLLSLGLRNAVKQASQWGIAASESFHQGSRRL